MFYIIAAIAVAMPAVFGFHFVTASKEKLRAEACRFPKWILPPMEPNSRKERLVFGFWRSCGWIALLFSAVLIYLVFSTTVN